MDTTSPGFVSVRELGERVRTRQVSPVELVEYFLERLETHGPAYNAVVTITRERAMEQARRAEAEIVAGKYRGPLHGIPVAFKDLIDVAGLAALDQGVAEIGQWPRLVRRLAGAILPQRIAVPPNQRSIDGCRHQQDDDNDCCRGDQVPAAQGSAHEQDKRQDRHQARQV